MEIEWIVLYIGEDSNLVLHRSLPAEYCRIYLVHKALDIDRLWQSHHHSIEYLIPDFLLYITEYPARHPLTASQNIIENREYLRFLYKSITSGLFCAGCCKRSLSNRERKCSDVFHSRLFFIIC